ncbi:hypothetical protein CLCR_06497 [Cladophialophora carrionii]|uniref:Uncharacterized protein n=1 Tax=Cladophialophora carrionii TaxID=86049 RepID=A0A1C1C7M0_9EURO|nr:hypothetical protein CLCR_06497 [Cladophialophora carrionii]
MSHFTIGAFVATTATALAPFLAVYYLPRQQTTLQTPAAALATLPKPRPLAALRETREQAAVGTQANSATEFNLL